MSRKKLVVITLTVVVGLVSISALAVYLRSRGDSGHAPSITAGPVTTTPPPTTTEPSPEPENHALPADVLDLSNWKLTLPMSTTSHDEAEEITQPALATYKNKKFFHVNRDDSGVVFRSPAGGATTSGSDYPRSELREMTAQGSREASWSNASGKHVMTVTQAITSIPRVKSEVVAGQIHDSEDDVIMVRLEKKRLFVEADGDDVGVLDNNYTIGTKFTVQISASASGIKIRYNDSRVVTYDKVGKGYYFKAGCYTQSNTDRGDDSGASGEVVIYDLDISHS